MRERAKKKLVQKKSENESIHTLTQCLCTIKHMLGSFPTTLNTNTTITAIQSPPQSICSFYFGCYLMCIFHIYTSPCICLIAYCPMRINVCGIYYTCTSTMHSDSNIIICILMVVCWRRG